MSRPRILIVDDEQHMLSLLSMTLRKSGYEVLTAGSGRQALELAGAFELSLMVVDQSMPGMTGFELTQRVGPGTPVVMVTARPEVHGRDHPHFAAVIQKPFSPRELVACVRDIVGPGHPGKEQSA